MLFFELFEILDGVCIANAIKVQV